MTRKNIYIAMYRALDCLYDESPNEELGEYLSEANPYLFKDMQSDDPAIEEIKNWSLSEKRHCNILKLIL